MLVPGSILLLCLVLAQAALAQRGIVVPDTGYAILEDLILEGNRKTRRNYVLRELGLAAGDTIFFAELPELLRLERRRLLNSGLFNEARLSVTAIDTARRGVTIGVRVREKWYAYPQVDFDLADRNFNVWVQEQNASLDRINYGLRLRHANLTGRADRLTFFVQGGYTRTFQLNYEIPFVDKERIFGLEVTALVDRNREWWAYTEDGQQEFYKVDTANVLRRRRFGGGIVVRPGLNTVHRVRLNRHTNKADSTLALSINTEFFGEGRTSQRYWSLSYELNWDRRDVRPYPLRGHLLAFTIAKEGLGSGDDVNRLNTSLRYTYYAALGGPIYLSLNGKVKTDLVRTPVPYFNREALGFGSDFLRGYQYYVIDGLDYAYLRNTLRVKTFEKDLRFPWMPVRRLREVPTRLFLTAHGDLGGVHDPYETPGNLLGNRILGSYGVGADLVFYYGSAIRFELTRNELGSWGGYLSYAVGL